MAIEPNKPAEPADAYIGRKAVDLGLITANQLREVLLQLSRPGVKNPPTLGSTLVEKGLITAQQLGVISDLAQRTTPQRIGKYGIVRELGKGGMGIVYEAEDPELGRRVALKMLLLEFNLNPSESAVEEERFTREARLSANLPKHPNIVGVYEAGVAEGQRFIAMEYVEGKQFSDWRIQKSVTLRQQIAVLRDAALAVDHAHRHNVVHRDLKPANILVDADLHPHVTDFGLAKRERGDPTFALTVTGTVMGTPAYMSPEQAEGKRDVDSRADIWALGVMLYEILTNRVPFEAETPLKVVMRTVKDPVTPPSGLLRGASLTSLDRTLEAVCMKALTKNPKGRHATARLFADDLTRWIKGEKGTVRGKAPEKAPKTWIYGGIAAAVVVLAGVLYAALSPSSSEEAAERAREYVGQGQRLLAQGKYSDALVKFGQALSEDPGNRAAVAGRKEAEGKLIAAAQPPPAPAGPSREETEKKAIAQDLAELDTLITSYRGKENYGPARELLTQALRRRDRADWVAAITVRQEDLKKGLDGLFETLKAKAADSKRRGDAAGLEALKARVARWGIPPLSKELDDALAGVPAPAPAPAVKAPQAPLTGTATELPPLRGFKNAVNSLAFSADEKTLITTDFDKSVRLWDIGGRSERATLAGGESFISSAGSADGRWLAAGSMDGKLRIWDAAALKLRIFAAHGGQLIALAFSPDSSLLASASVDGTVRLWDPVTGLPRGVLEGHPKGALSVAFSPDGKQIATGSAELLVRVWDPSSGREIRRIDIEPGTGILGLGFLPDGKTLAGGGQSGKLNLWEVETGRGRVLGSHTKGIRGLVVAPDGRWIATVSQDGLRVWDPLTGLVALSGSEEGGFFSVAVSRKGHLLAGGGANWSVRFWDTSVFSK